MNNFTKRLIFGALYVAILAFGMLFGQPYFALLFFALMLVTLYEFNKMQGIKGGITYIIAGLFYLYINSSIFLQNNFVSEKNISLILLLLLFFNFAYVLFGNKKNVTKHLGNELLSLVYIAIPFALMSRIPYVNNENSYRFISILSVFILVWINDTFAYLVGKNFGRHKLLERISPKKTIEGFIGGMLFTFLGAYLLSFYFTDLSLGRWFVFAGIISVFGVIGDLVESMFKRQAGVKDSSNFIPGHGGFLDRLDSVIFVAPFIFVYLMLVNNG